MDVLFLVDRQSFPKRCPELQDLLTLVDGEILEVDTESPTVYFNKAIELADKYDLVVPITRNFFIRDRLRQEGVNLIICI